jgi:type IX secretion system PorP/SprF family membrane protein
MRLILVCLVGVAQLTFGQSGFQFSQYIFNSQAINPAWFNYRSPVSLQLSSRVQWLDINGTPNTHALVGQFNIGEHHTVGGIVLNDHIATWNKLQISGTYGYRINLGENAQLNFGIRAGYMNQTANISGYLTDAYDPVLYARRSVHHFSVGAGIYASGNRFFAGISAPDLFNNGLAERSFSTSLNGSAYHLMFGVKVIQSIPFMFYPSMLVSATVNGPVYASIDLNSLIYKSVWVTIGANTNLGTSVGIGYLFDNGLRIVYSYGFSFGPFSKYGGGINELTIGYAKDVFYNEFAKRKFTNGKGSHKSTRQMKRRFK